MDGEGQEEEKVKFQKRNVDLGSSQLLVVEGDDDAYLVGQIALLQARVSTDALVDGPGELVVQLPGLKSEEDGGDGHENGQGDEHGLDVVPEVLGDEGGGVQDVSSVFDLVELDGGIDQNAHVVHDQANDLNGVFQAQGVPDEEQLVDVAEHEDGKVGRDGAGLILDTLGGEVQLALEFAKDIAGRWLAGWRRRAGASTYASRASAMMAWPMAVSIKAHVHLVLGTYILGARRTGGGRVVGKPSRWW